MRLEIGRVQSPAGHCTAKSQEGIISAVSSPWFSARSDVIRAKIPLSLHRVQRLENVLCGASLIDASRHLKPLQLMKIILLNTRGSSTRGFPRNLGKKGSRRAICASVSQNRPGMFSAHVSSRAPYPPCEIQWTLIQTPSSRFL